MGMSGPCPACPPPLEARDLRAGYPGREVLHRISLRIYPGQTLALLGPNGSGKSTLLRVLLGLIKPASGEVLLHGQNLATLRRADIARELAYVPQHANFTFAFTSRQRLLHLAYSRADRETAHDALARMGADHLAGRVFATLSGGERQLVLIARALAQETPLILMDEPVTGLDYGHQIRLLGLLRELAHDLGKAVVQTTHHPEHARASADTVALLKNGCLLSHGTPAEVLTHAALATLYGLSPAHLDDFLTRSCLST
jgi:iron complex transport system ATP-binding protein